MSTSLSVFDAQVDCYSYLESNLAVAIKCMYLEQSYFYETILQVKESIDKTVCSNMFAAGLLTVTPNLKTT